MFCIILYNFLPLILIFLDIVLFYLVIHSFCVYLFFYMLYLSIITDWLHYVLHGSRILLEKLTGCQLVKKLPAFYGTWIFITTFTSACHLSLSWARSVQSMSLPPSHLLPSMPRSSKWSLFLRFSPPKLCIYHSSPIRTIRPAHLILLDFITWIIFGEE